MLLHLNFLMKNKILHNVLEGFTTRYILLLPNSKCYNHQPKVGRYIGKHNCKMVMFTMIHFTKLNTFIVICTFLAQKWIWASGRKRKKRTWTQWRNYISHSSMDGIMDTEMSILVFRRYNSHIVIVKWDNLSKPRLLDHKSLINLRIDGTYHEWNLCIKFHQLPLESICTSFIWVYP